MKNKDVRAWICKMPKSEYFGLNPLVLRLILNKRVARSYLSKLIVINEMDKSNFPLITEQSSQPSDLQSYWMEQSIIQAPSIESSNS